MKRFVKPAVVAALFLAGSAAAQAQSTASASASGSVTIVQPITLTKTADLAFGRIVKPVSGTGTVTIANTADTVTAASGAVALTSSTSRAKFTINGEGGQAVSVTVPASFNMTHTNGTDTISVSLTGDLGASTTLSNALGAAGSKTLNVGGAFSLPSSATTGAYSGTFQVSVAYQ